MRQLVGTFCLLFFACGGTTKPPVCPKQTSATPTPSKAGARLIGALELDGVPTLPERVRQRMAKYLGVRGSAFADWDEKGKGMLIRTRFGQTTQVHRVKTPMGAREQLTFYREPVSAASWVPGGYDGAFVIRMDKGGAENAQLYRVGLLEGRTTSLTKDKSRTLAFIWSKKSKLAFSNNARNGRDFDIYVGDGKSAKSVKLVYQAKGYFVPLDFSADESKLLLQQYISLNETYLYILDIASGKAEKLEIGAAAKEAAKPKKAAAKKAAAKKAAAKKAAAKKAPAKEKKGTVAKKSAGAEKTTELKSKARKNTVAFRDAVWGPKDRGIYFTSDKGSEFVELYYYDLKKRQAKPLSNTISWNVEQLAMASDGRTLAFTTNEGGYSRLWMLDTRRKKAKQVKVPDGIIRDMRFSRNPKMKTMLGFTLYRPTSPGDAYSYETRRRKLERWTKSEVGGLNSDFFVAPTLINYPTFDQVSGKPRQISAFYYKPPGSGPHPVVIYIHGGPESQFRPYFRSLIHYLLMEMGVAVIAPNVRGSDGYGKSYLLLDNGMRREDSVKDIGALLEWLKGRKELDPKRVVVYGGSYGGYMVLASLVKYGAKLAGGVDWVGISNFVTFLKNTKAYRRDLRRAEYGDERDGDMKSFLQSISPLTNVKKITSPLFVIQGANDPRVPRSEAEQLVKAVRGQGRKVWYLLAHNEGHGFRKKDNRDMARMLTVLFLESIGFDKK
jgi:dipeptidyl aminopeptidase/acylaminoacyl peptidase